MCANGSACSPPMAFPRPRGRGPIEATPPSFRLSPSYHGFLDREVEAQLKPGSRRAARRHAAWFPRPRGRGPIEACRDPRPVRTEPAGFLDREVEAQLKLPHLAELGPGDAAFPRPRGRGPIEAAQEHLLGIRASQVSSTARSRPN